MATFETVFGSRAMCLGKKLQKKWCFVTKIVLTFTVRKKCSSDQGKTFEIRG
jgi:hypothetical protein